MSPGVEEQIEGLKRAIAEMEAQRESLGDEVVDAGLVPFQRKLGELVARLEARQVGHSGVAARQRKLVTLLFMDIAGSTSISQHMDPEEVRDVFDAALKKLSEPIEAHGGRVTRFMGDGYLSVFGAPTAREDDPERAVRAGLEIIASAGEIAKDLQDSWDIEDFQVRVGINTGLVALGGVTEAEDTLMGAPVNLAARLESAAPPAGLLVSYATYQHIRGVFDAEPWEPLQVKGFDEPVQVYRILSARPRAFRIRTRGVEGVETRMVGRYDELKYLQDALLTAIEEGEGQLVTITGEAGVGKSRLLYEFQNWIELEPQQVFFFEGRGRQEAQGMPFGLLRDVFELHFEIQDEDSAESARRKIEEGFSEVFGEVSQKRMQAHILGQLLGFDFSAIPELKEVLNDPEQFRNQGLMHLGEYFRGLSSQGPVVIFLEDIHWADGSSLDALNWLGAHLHRQPLLAVCAARPSLFDQRPYWGEGLEYHHCLNLEPLSKRESRQLVEEILKYADHVPQALRDMVVEGAEGNPFYLEELVKMLVENGVIIKGEERWQIKAERLPDIEVPPTLAGVLQARLDSLPVEERTLLQQASAVGRKFWDRVVAYIQASGDGQNAVVPEALNALRRRELIYRREASAFVDAREYLFKHDILREVTYETVLLHLRRQYHALTAQWFLERSALRVEEFAGIIGDHLIKAGRQEEALQHLIRAAENARVRYANKEAVEYYSRALETLSNMRPLPLDAASLAKLHMERGMAYETLGEFERARADYESAQNTAHEAGMREVEWHALLDLGKLWASRDYNQTGSYFRQALELARQMDDPALLARSLNRVGNWYTNAENPLEAIGHHQEALEIFEKLENQQGLASTLDLLGMVNLLVGDNFKATRYLDQAIAIFRELDDRPGLASSLSVRGAFGPLYEFELVVASALLQEGIPYGDEALQIASEIGWRAGESFALWGRGLRHAAMGQYGQALEAIQNGLHIASEIEHHQWMAGHHFNLGIVYSDLMAPEEARYHSQKALNLSKEIRSQYWIYVTTGTLAKAYLLLDDPAQGKACLDAVLNPQTPMDSFAKRYCWARRAELALAQRETALALEIIDRLLNFIPGLSPGVVISSLWRLRAEALAAVGSMQEAEPLLRAAIENAQALGERNQLWRIHASLGHLYRLMNRRDQAEEEFLAAGELIEGLAATIPDEALKDNFLQQAHNQLIWT